MQADIDVGFYICCSRADYHRAFAVSQIYGLQVSIRIFTHPVYENTRPNTNALILIVIAADGLYKRDVFRMCRSDHVYARPGLQVWCLGFPDPFAVATIGGEQTQTTTVIKKTLNPYWNETFDLYVLLFLSKNYCF